MEPRFPQRNLIILLTFSVILVTLVLQGLTLPPLIRALGLAGATESHHEQAEARRLILEIALQHIEDQRPTQNDTNDLAAAFDDLALHYKRRLASITTERAAEDDVNVTDHARLVDISRQLLRVERQTAIRLRNEGRISDQVLRQLEHELDLSETRLDAMPDT